MKSFEMKKLSRKEFLKTLARKRVGAGVVFLNKKKQVLLVKPSYKNYWILPGRIIDRNESPKDGATREVEEEIGIKIKDLKLVSLFWGVEKEYDDDYLMFTFYGGVIENEEEIRVDGDEIIDFQFVSKNKLKDLVSPGTNRRIFESLQNINPESIVSVYTEGE